MELICASQNMSVPAFIDITEEDQVSLILFNIIYMCALAVYIVLSFIMVGQSISNQVLVSSELSNGPITNRSLRPVSVHY